MAEGFITRRGGVAAIERTASPNINFVSKTGNQIVVTFTNAEANEVDIFYGITSTLTDKVTVAASGTSSNVTFSGLDPNTAHTVSAYAIVTDATLKKIKSDIITTSITTDDIAFIEATGGTILTYEESGTFYKSHTFTSSGNFVVNTLGSTPELNEVDYLIIAGGGGGAGATLNGASGGGGAGGYRTTNGTSGGNSSAENKITAIAQSYEIIIGAGGASGANLGNFSALQGENGGNSSVFGITSIGGGGSGSSDFSGGSNGKNGGSGGGAGGLFGDIAGLGIAGQGFDGTTFGDPFHGGAGGGAGQAGESPDPERGRNGGNGLSNTLRNGTLETRGGGGGGGGNSTTQFGLGGSGGGGNGGNDNSPAVDGAVNTGGGAGGRRTTVANGKNGGSGIVVIRYEIAPSA